MARRGRDASPPGKTVYPQHIGQTQMRHKTYSRRACYDEWARQGAYKASTNNLVSSTLDAEYFWTQCREICARTR